MDFITWYIIMENNINTIDYNQEPVFYCKKCLSLKIRDVEHIDGSEYCDECGTTDIGTASIEEWENLYVQRYGHKYLENY